MELGGGTKDFPWLFSKQDFSYRNNYKIEKEPNLAVRFPKDLKLHSTMPYEDGIKMTLTNIQKFTIQIPPKFVNWLPVATAKQEDYWLLASQQEDFTRILAKTI